MRYFGVGVVMIVIGVPLGLGTLSGAGLIVAGGLCFVADAITRLTEELHRQSGRTEEQRRGKLPPSNRWSDDEMDDSIREQLGLDAD